MAILLVLASHGLSSSYRTEIHTDHPVPPVFETVSDVEAAPVFRESLEVYRAEGIRSLLVVPLQLQNALPEGSNAGTITFYWRSRRTIFSTSMMASSTTTPMAITSRL